MPILELRSLEQKPVLAYLEAVMLYPNDPDQRDRAIRGAKALHVLEYVRSGGSPPPEDITEALETAFTLPAWEEIRKEADRQSTLGTIAGNFLYHLLAADERGEVDTFVRIRDQMTDPSTDIGRACRAQRISSARHIENIWRDYRSVAHLYSARQTLNSATNEAIIDFPCSIGQLPGFLAFAERDRKAGEALRLQRSKQTALIAGETWRVPDEITLPELPDI